MRNWNRERQYSLRSMFQFITTVGIILSLSPLLSLVTIGVLALLGFALVAKRGTLAAVAFLAAYLSVDIPDGRELAITSGFRQCLVILAAAGLIYIHVLRNMIRRRRNELAR